MHARGSPARAGEWQNRARGTLADASLLFSFRGRTVRACVREGLGGVVTATTRAALGPRDAPRRASSRARAPADAASTNGPRDAGPAPAPASASATQRGGAARPNAGMGRATPGGARPKLRRANNKKRDREKKSFREAKTRVTRGVAYVCSLARC